MFVGKTLIVSICIAFNLRLTTQSECGKILESGVNSKVANTIVNRHNEIRKMLGNGQVPNQPKATNMGSLKWDAVLAKRAQNIADTCIFAHVKVSDGRWAGVGQNLYMTASTAPSKGPQWVDAVNGWYNEYKIYDYPNFSLDAGHYTQVIWADTKYVGCGYTYFEKDNEKFRYKKIYVCNYGPAGNVIGQLPYKTA